MEYRYVDASKMKSLEDYAIALVMGILSLKTLESFHVRAVDLGVLKEDHECRLNTIVWDLKRIMKLYNDQLASILELVPDDFNVESIMESLRQQELSKARSIVRMKK